VRPLAYADAATAPSMRGPAAWEERQCMAKMQNLIVDDRARGVFRVNRRAFTDPEILEQERREVFDRSWLYAGDESEIADPGDYVTRRVGGRPLIPIGQYRHVLMRGPSGPLFRERRAVLDLETPRPHGKLSFIL